MSRRRISPERYRVISAAALVLLAVIVVSGGLVRLTGSGLGCDDWPNCNDEKIIDVSSAHAAVEQINRLFTGLVAAGVALAVAGSVFREPRRRDLTWLSWGLVAGVIGQVVLGGITVLVDLHPLAVQGHFLLSMVLIANATVLWYRAGLSDARRVARVSTPIRRHVWALAVWTGIVIVIGTVVTGAGPHAGDEEARRFGVDIGQTARLHSASVWVTVAIAAALMWRLRSRASDRAVLENPLMAWIGLAFLQGAVGYLQYFSGIPVALVAVHLALATALFTVTVWLIEVMKVAVTGPGTGSAPDVGSDERLHEFGGLVDDRREEAADV